MQFLKQLIKQEAAVISGEIINLDSILTHQFDPQAILTLGKEFADRFREKNVTKVITMESSGISLAFAAALELGVPVLFARRRKTPNMGKDALHSRVPSFTKGMVTDIWMDHRLLQQDDRVIIIDDIIANGDTMVGLISLIERSGAQLLGIGVAVEKCFQSGAGKIREQGHQLESLVRIAAVNDGQIVFE